MDPTLSSVGHCSTTQITVIIHVTVRIVEVNLSLERPCILFIILCYQHNILHSNCQHFFYQLNDTKLPTFKYLQHLYFLMNCMKQTINYESVSLYLPRRQITYIPSQHNMHRVTFFGTVLLLFSFLKSLDSLQ